MFEYEVMAKKRMREFHRQAQSDHRAHLAVVDQNTGRADQGSLRPPRVVDGRKPVDNDVRKDSEARRIARILVPTDFSPDALHSVIQAVEWSQRFGAHLILMTVITQKMAAAEVAHGGYVDRLAGDLRRAIISWFTQNVPPALRRGVSVEPLVVVGPPAQAIIEEAKTQGVSMIVMAMRRRSWLHRLVRRSVTETVLRAFPSPALTIAPLVAD